MKYTQPLILILVTLLLLGCNSSKGTTDDTPTNKVIHEKSKDATE